MQKEKRALHSQSPLLWALVTRPLSLVAGALSCYRAFLTRLPSRARSTALPGGIRPTRNGRAPTLASRVFVACEVAGAVPTARRCTRLLAEYIDVTAVARAICRRDARLR